MSIKTYSISEVAQSMSITDRWLVEQLRTGRFPGRKIGRHWRMTEQDVSDALDACRNDAPALTEARGGVLPINGLTPRSRQRVYGLSTFYQNYRAP